MAAQLLSPTSSRLRLGLALVASALLHGSAIAVASLHRSETVADISAPWTDAPIVDIDDPNETPDSLPPEIVELPPLPTPNDPPLFSEITAPLTPRKPDSAPIPKRPSRAPVGPRSPSARALAVHAPLPAYPYEARRARITGEGIAILTVAPASGQVMSVAMAQSTGSAILDQAAVAGLRRWRFRAGTPTTVRCPITYTLTGAMF